MYQAFIDERFLTGRIHIREFMAKFREEFKAETGSMRWYLFFNIH